MNSMQTLQRVTAPGEIRAVAELASEIWNDHFVPIIGQEQVDYMLKRFQSEEAVSAQIQSDYEYYLISEADRPEGYIGLIPGEPPGKMMLSKLYVRRTQRHRGLGSRLLEFAKQQCRSRGMTALRLTVNRHNQSSIDWYRRKGFAVVDEVKADIGSGFYMDDFIMELDLSAEKGGSHES